MLYRKFATHLEQFLNNEPNKILLVNGARQIGKSFIIRNVGTRLFKNFIEINLKADKPQVLYVWGHSYEMDAEYISWREFEEFCKMISGKDDIFYGTNGQIFLK